MRHNYLFLILGAILFMPGCKTIPITPDQITGIISDGTLDSTPAVQRVKIIHVLESAAQAVTIAQEQAQAETKWATVGKTLSAVGIGLLVVLLLSGAIWLKYQFFR